MQPEDLNPVPFEPGALMPLPCSITTHPPNLAVLERAQQCHMALTIHKMLFQNIHTSINRETTYLTILYLKVATPFLLIPGGPTHCKVNDHRFLALSHSEPQLSMILGVGIFKRRHPHLSQGFRGLTYSNNPTGFNWKTVVHTLYSSARSIHSSTEFSVDVQSPGQDVVIALGSNVGNRITNFNEALSLMKRFSINITRHSFLYETAPAYVTDQPLFLNAAVRGTTKLGPHELLKALKKIEKDLGRTDGIRYGPRPIDLDILFYGRNRIDSEALTVPHQRIWERPFVMAPLLDLLESSIDNDTVASWHSLSRHSDGLFGLWQELGGESLIGSEGLRRVLPVGNRLWDWSKKTHVMGVLNLTPDSFSDGGKFQEVEAAVSHVRLLLSEGADIIDIGAQSTRPFAHRISVEEELQRLTPVIDAIVNIPEVEGKLLSVDTFYAEVASEAVKRGVHIVNDVSGGQLDPDILRVIGDLGVPYIAMHMRGDPSTMQSKQNLDYEDVCQEVASELCGRVSEAELSGIPLWRIIIDPGIGFSKKSEQNLEILTGLSSIREEMGRKSLAMSRAPFLIGPSRKRFLGEICSHTDPAERDPATIAAVTAGVLGGANIVRVHNVKDCVDAAKVCDALLKVKKS